MNLFSLKDSLNLTLPNINIYNVGNDLIYQYVIHSIPSIGGTLNTLLTNVKVRKLWNDYILPLYQDSIIGETESEITNDVSEELTLEFINRLIPYLINSLDKYSVIIDNFDSQKSNMIRKLESTNSITTRFNDTPQNGGEWIDDNHTTNITTNTSTSSADSGSIMAQLNELNDNYKSIYHQWAIEMERLFLEE